MLSFHDTAVQTYHHNVLRLHFPVIQIARCYIQQLIFSIKITHISTRSGYQTFSGRFLRNFLYTYFHFLIYLHRSPLTF